MALSGEGQQMRMWVKTVALVLGQVTWTFSCEGWGATRGSYVEE